MSNEIAVFQQRPAYLDKYRTPDASNDEYDVGPGGAPIGKLSIQGKEWTAKYPGIPNIPLRDDGGYPARFFDSIIVKANKAVMKSYYIEGFKQDSTEPPDCASSDSIKPDVGVKSPQHINCKDCRWNQWNSAVDEKGQPTKGKRCKDNKRLAVLPEGDLECEIFGGPLLLRLPVTTLKIFRTFTKECSKLGILLHEIVVRMSFVQGISQPTVQFERLRWLDEEELDRIMQWREHEHVDYMLSIDAPVEPGGDGDDFVGPDTAPPQQTEKVAATQATQRAAPPPPPAEPTPPPQPTQRRAAFGGPRAETPPPPAPNGSAGASSRPRAQPMKAPPAEPTPPPANDPAARMAELKRQMAELEAKATAEGNGPDDETDAVLAALDQKAAEM